MSESNTIESKEEYANPLKQPFAHLVGGFALTFMTFQFGGLQYLLPFFGVYELFYGLHLLKGENADFHKAWILSIVRLGFNLFDLIMEVSPLREAGFYPYLGYISVGLHFLMLIECRRGMAKLYHKNLAEQTRDPFLWALVWEAAVFFCALFLPGSGLIPVIILLVWMIGILCSIAKIPDDFEPVAPVACHVSEKPAGTRFFVLYVTGSILLVGGVCLAANRNRAEFKEYQPVSVEDYEAAKHLVKMDFPTELVDVLPQETMDLFKDAVMIQQKPEILRFNTQELYVNSIFVEVPDHCVYTILYFHWNKGNACWNDGFKVMLGDVGNEMEILEGRLIYTKGNQMYSAQVPRLNPDVFTEDGWFGTSSSYQIRGGASFPIGARKQSGYLIYRAKYQSENMVNFYMNYYHRFTPFQIPYQKPEDGMENSNSVMRQYSGYYEVTK